MTNGGTFEALNYALRKSKDGVIVSFVVHPSDVDSALTALPIGARVEIKWAEIGDELPASANGRPSDFDSENSGSNPEAGASLRGREAATAAPQRPAMGEAVPAPRNLSLSSQCALRCKDKRFWEWIAVESENDAADWVRRYCDVTSRSLLDSMPKAAERWQRAETKFQNWLTQQMHAGSYR